MAATTTTTYILGECQNKLIPKAVGAYDHISFGGYEFGRIHVLLDSKFWRLDLYFAHGRTSAMRRGVGSAEKIYIWRKMLCGR